MSKKTIDTLTREIQAAMQKKDFERAQVLSQEITGTIALTSVESYIAQAAEALEEGRAVQAVEIIDKADITLISDPHLNESYLNTREVVYSAAVENLFEKAKKIMEKEKVTKRNLADAMRYCERALEFGTFLNFLHLKDSEDIEERIDQLVGFQYASTTRPFYFDDRGLSKSNYKARIKKLLNGMITAVNDLLETEKSPFCIGPGYERVETTLAGGIV